MRPLVELAEALGAAVVDGGVRFAMPTGHALNATGIEGLLDEADVVLALDADDLRGPLGNDSAATVLGVSLGHLRLRGWAHDYQELVPSAIQVTAGADSVVAALVERLRARPADPGAVRSRTSALAARTAAARERWRTEAAGAEADGAVPLERLVYELGRALEGRPHVLANGTNQRIEHRLWSMTEARQYLGWHAGGGLGYGVGAAIGAALALEPGTISVDVQADGDLLYLPSGLWTAARLSLPVLVVVHNNRQYGNSVEHAEAIARHRERSPERRYLGTSLDSPAIGIAELAGAFGVWSRGPVSDSTALAGALHEAVEVVAGGRPALLEVLTPGA
jgi:thiamine pyrophosphate-dependent acetolactate synthase large subunit-like protein